jgi:hypothetical protein
MVAIANRHHNDLRLGASASRNTKRLLERPDFLVTFDGENTGHYRSKRIGQEFFQQKQTKITKAKEERDIG